MAGFMSRLGAMVNPFDEESRARRAENKQRTQDLGFASARYPQEQADAAAGGNEDIAMSTAEGVIRKGSEGGRTGLDMANFDPSNAESVRQMQRMLNQGGFRDQEGESLGEDGRMGPKTEAALRRAQGGYRDDFASMDELKGGEGSFFEKATGQNINQAGKEHLASREGRGDSIVPTNDPEGFGGWTGQTNKFPDFSPNSRQREEAVGWGRSKAKGIDDAIEQAAPWLTNSGAYRGAKTGIKNFFNRAGDSSY